MSEKKEGSKVWYFADGYLDIFDCCLHKVKYFYKNE